MAVLSVARPRAGARWHRRIGAFACFAIVSWSLSGALHPLMSRYQPQSAQRLPPALPALPALAPALDGVLAKAGIAEVADARMIQSGDGMFWRVEPTGSLRARHFSATDGVEMAAGEARYAAFLARHYLGDTAAAIDSITRNDAFDREYAFVNRLLPVYRVAFARADGMRVYVDTRHGMLATLVDERKAAMSWIFGTFHSWHFIGGERLRVLVAAMFVSTVIATPLLGIALYIARRGRLPRRRGQRIHRVLGLTVALLVLCSATSGAYHLLKGARDRAATAPGPWRVPQRLAASALRTERLATLPGPYQSLTLVEVNGRPYARVTALAPAVPPAAHHHAGAPPPAAPTPTRYIGLADAAPAMTDEDYARLLAITFANQLGITIPASAPLELIGGFGGEYGFINKLLPVYRITGGPAATRLYVHPDTRGLAARVTRADYAEGWTFANFHKWQAMEKWLGRWPRDLLQIAFALSSAAVALLGLRLLRSR